MHTVDGLAHASKKSLRDIKGLSEQKVEKLKAAGACRLPSTPREHLLPPCRDNLGPPPPPPTTRLSPSPPPPPRPPPPARASIVVSQL